ncbi:hypothetical protein [Antarcticibacterium sp. W02-3]|uniref:hypothetical protein n=1 Tax=Antarcticibacterium sp. W02-3 TaxID=2183747 RepID=UPI0020432F04|nr:hypothetical protein [Antarcticibacterium sp. W02-3]
MDYHYTQDRAEDRDSFTPAFRSRPNTELIVTKQETPGSSKRVRVIRIDQLFDCLENDTDIAKPADTIFMVSHGAARGWLGLHLADVDDDNKDESSILYETLEAALAKGLVKIGPNTVGPNTKVHLVACNVGSDRTIPYLVKLKEVFGNQVPVSASKHLYVCRTINSAGQILYLKYDFELFVKEPFKGANSWAELIQAFMSKNFDFISLAIVLPSEEIWKQWVPNPIPPENENRTIKQWVNFVPPIKDRNGREINRRHFSVVFKSKRDGIEFTVENIDHDMNDDAKNLQSAENFIRNSERNLPVHSFPIFKRLGYSSQQDMIDGYTWKITPNFKKKEIKVALSRFVYNVRVPVCGFVDPTNKNANELIYNYYPFENNSHGILLENLDHNDTDLFQTV